MENNCPARKGVTKERCPEQRNGGHKPEGNNQKCPSLARVEQELAQLGAEATVEDLKLGLQRAHERDMAKRAKEIYQRLTDYPGAVVTYEDECWAWEQAMALAWEQKYQEEINGPGPVMTDEDEHWAWALTITGNEPFILRAEEIYEESRDRLGIYATEDGKRWLWDQALKLARDEQVYLETKKVYQEIMDRGVLQPTELNKTRAWFCALILGEQKVPQARHGRPAQSHNNFTAPGSDHHQTPEEGPECPEEGEESVIDSCGGSIYPEMGTCPEEGEESTINSCSGSIQPEIGTCPEEKEESAISSEQTDFGDVHGFAKLITVESKGIEGVIITGPPGPLGRDIQSSSFISSTGFKEGETDPVGVSDVPTSPSTGPHESTSPQKCQALEGLDYDNIRSDLSASHADGNIIAYNHYPGAQSADTEETIPEERESPTVEERGREEEAWGGRPDSGHKSRDALQDGETQKVFISSLSFSVTDQISLSSATNFPGLSTSVNSLLFLLCDFSLGDGQDGGPALQKIWGHNVLWRNVPEWTMGGPRKPTHLTRGLRKPPDPRDSISMSGWSWKPPKWGI